MVPIRQSQGFQAVASGDDPAAEWDGSNPESIYALEVESSQIRSANGSFRRRCSRIACNPWLLQASLVGTCSVVVALFLILVLQEQPTLSQQQQQIEAGALEGERDPQWTVRPTNLHIVVIGDSTIHYQYLSLVYFLKTSRWFDPMVRRSHLTNVYSFQNLFHDHVYGEYFFQTMRALQPDEICDCFYPYSSDSYRMPRHPEHVMINRYFHDLERNNTVRFFHAYGHEFNVSGRLQATKIPLMEGYEQDELLDAMTNNEAELSARDVQWSTQSWAELLKEHIATLSPRPQVLLLNAGKHKHDFGASTVETQALQKAVGEMNLTMALWRTTTYKKGGAVMNDKAVDLDHTMCRILGGCLNISWTQRLDEDQYWDAYHNYEPVYRMMNEALLDLVGALPIGYIKYNMPDVMTAANDGT